MHSNSASAPLVPLIQGTKPMTFCYSIHTAPPEWNLHPAGLQGTTAVAINNRPYFSFSSKFHPYGAAWRCDLHPCQKGGECYANNLHHDREVPRLHSLLHHVPKPLPDKPTSRRSPQMGFSLPSNTDQLSQADPPAPHHPCSLKVSSSSWEAPAWTTDSEFIKSESHIVINQVLGNVLVSTVKQDTGVVTLTNIIRASMKVKPPCSKALNT